MSFEAYVHWRVNHGDRKFLQQKDYCFDSNGDNLVDFIGRYEEYKDDFCSICRKIEINEPRLPQLNTSEHNYYRRYYNQRTLTLVANLYQDDIDCFGYEF